ncbi:MAG: hypothetical protein ABSA39_18130 [Edaphobacter sp.]
MALRAEEQRRRELEAGYNNVRQVRKNRLRTLEEIIDEYLVGYRSRYRSASFAEYALGHVSPHRQDHGRRPQRGNGPSLSGRPSA